MNKKQKENKSMKEEIGILEESEDVTKYGEFVTTYFAWLTLDKQRKRGRELEEITKKKSYKNQN